MPAALPLPLPGFLKQAIVGQVRAVFNDQARGERPVQRSDNAMFAPGSVIWRVHGDVTTMMVGGVAALLLQMLHPAVLAGVWDHSNFRQDMLGRLRRTARFIALTTYGDREEAATMIARVRRIHDHIGGTLPDGTPYSATDPRLLAWVHVTEATSFLDAWIRYAEPRMTARDQDRYFAEIGEVAVALGADPVPCSRDEARSLVREMRAELAATDRSTEVARILLGQRATNPAVAPVQAVTFQAAIDLLPAWAQRMHGLSPSPLSVPLVRGGALGLARTLRWAFS
ncbi:oxygenase MpaB family protein [Sphingomonas sp. Tas61C01]|uniref:oxygenase MpaB family protein n=1 Tax=Sphingomonas sp. Tas61C01 TaxID=3458297 RepID=UPI00403E65E2